MTARKPSAAEEPSAPQPLPPPAEAPAAPDAAVAVSVHALQRLLTAAAKHGDDAELVAAAAAFSL